MTGDNNEELINGLNEDLAAEYQAVIMYRTYASLVSGPYRQELRAFFEGEIPDELAHAGYLADKIVALGGTPAVEAAPIPITKDNREMLENTLKAEIDTIERYTRRIDQAEQAGEIALKRATRGHDPGRKHTPRRHPPHAGRMAIGGDMSRLSKMLAAHPSPAGSNGEAAMEC